MLLLLSTTLKLLPGNRPWALLHVNEVILVPLENEVLFTVIEGAIGSAYWSVVISGSSDVLEITICVSFIIEWIVE